MLKHILRGTSVKHLFQLHEGINQVEARNLLRNLLDSIEGKFVDKPELDPLDNPFRLGREDALSSIRGYVGDTNYALTSERIFFLNLQHALAASYFYNIPIDWQVDKRKKLRPSFKVYPVDTYPIFGPTYFTLNSPVFKRWIKISLTSSGKKNWKGIPIVEGFDADPNEPKKLFHSFEQLVSKKGYAVTPAPQQILNLFDRPVGLHCHENKILFADLEYPSVKVPLKVEKGLDPLDEPLEDEDTDKAWPRVKRVRTLQHVCYLACENPQKKPIRLGWFVRGKYVIIFPRVA